MRKIRVLVDYQVDFVNGALACPTAERMDEALVNWMEEGLSNGELVVVTLDTHDKNYLETREGRLLPVVHCISGTPGYGLYGRVAAFVAMHPEIMVLAKESFGLDPKVLTGMLGATEWVNSVEEVEFAGLDGNICVPSNICCFQALFPQARMVVDAALIDSVNRALLCETLDVLRGLQVKILNPPQFYFARPVSGELEIYVPYHVESFLDAIRQASGLMYPYILMCRGEEDLPEHLTVETAKPYAAFGF